MVAQLAQLQAELLKLPGIDVIEGCAEDSVESAFAGGVGSVLSEQPVIIIPTIIPNTNKVGFDLLVELFEVERDRLIICRTNLIKDELRVSETTPSLC